ncbi:MAG: hypothetical protein AMK73_03100 [Planctomycetes bacterium SM23_32]|nr:MAG: hypothetical protein AMK73_03100 [Planctomycetes bacterium SM23_32]
MRRRREGRGWFLLSLGLHALAIAALIYLTPVRDVVREIVRPTRPERTMSAGGLAELAEAIEEMAAEQIARNSRELRRVLGKMDEIEEGMADEFGAFDRDRRRTAAADALQEMDRALEEMQGAAESIEQQAPIETTDRHQALAEQAQERARRKLDMIASDVATAQQLHRRAEAAHQDAKAAHDRERDLKAAVAGVERQLAQEESRAEERLQAVERLKEQGRPEEQVQQESQGLAEQQERAREAAEQLAARRREREEAHRDALENQRSALALQREARQALAESARERPAPLVQLASSPRQTAARPEALPLLTEVEAPADQTDVAALYEGARAAEDTIAETFKEVRAMDLAMVRDMELPDARDDIDLVRPVRPDLDVDLLRDAVRSDERFEAHKREMEVALRETQSMVELAHRMLEMATQSVARMRFGTDVGAEPPPEEPPDFALIIRELAMEEVSGRFSDMAAMMRLAEQEAAGLRAPEVDFEDLTEQEKLERGLLAFSAEEPDQGEVPQLPPDVEAVRARKIGPGGLPGQWMYMDTWWTLGPFPNPNRVNIDREFPPDSLVDLDATYVGKDGRTIRWEFVQSDKPEIIPPNAEPYGIWYAYTEFHCDRPRDVLMAMGTDDRGTLKINGVPVWISSKRLKGWDIDEVWRRVHLRQGVNRILYRVENGWMHIGFSLVLRLDDE